MDKKTEFTVPKLDDFIKVPSIKTDSMAHSSPFVASPKHQEALNFPGELVDDWENKAIEKMAMELPEFRRLNIGDYKAYKIEQINQLNNRK